MVATLVPLQHLHLDVLSVIPAQRHVITLDKKLNRVAQGSDPFHHDGLAADQPHLHEATPRSTTTSDPEDPGPFPGSEVAQHNPGVLLMNIRTAASPAAPPPSFALSTKHEKDPWLDYCK